MSAATQRIPYERLMSASPLLLWALERRWSDEEARSKGMELDARENSAWLVLEGEARVRHGGETHRAGPGTWMFPSPGRREQSFEGTFHFLSLTLRWQWPEGTHLFEKGLTRTVAAQEVPWLEETAREVIRGVAAVSSMTYYLIGRHPVSLMEASRLFELAGRWATAFATAMDRIGVQPDTGTNRDPRVELLLARMRESRASTPPDRGAFAAAAGVSLRQVDRLLKDATGRTLVENHDLIRFESACGGLLEQGHRVKEVALGAGFRDLSSFSRWFTKRAGCSPRAYRKRFSIP